MIEFDSVSEGGEGDGESADGFLSPIRKSKRRSWGFNPGPEKFSLVYASVIIFVNCTLLAIWHFFPHKVLCHWPSCCYTGYCIFKMCYRTLFCSVVDPE